MVCPWPPPVVRRDRIPRLCHTRTAPGTARAGHTDPLQASLARSQCRDDATRAGKKACLALTWPGSILLWGSRARQTAPHGRTACSRGPGCWTCSYALSVRSSSNPGIFMPPPPFARLSAARPSIHVMRRRAGCAWLSRLVEQFNTRANYPTHWHLHVHDGAAPAAARRGRAAGRLCGGGRA